VKSVGFFCFETTSEEVSATLPRNLSQLANTLSAFSFPPATSPDSLQFARKTAWKTQARTLYFASFLSIRARIGPAQSIDAHLDKQPSEGGSNAGLFYFWQQLMPLPLALMGRSSRSSNFPSKLSLFTRGFN